MMDQAELVSAVAELTAAVGKLSGRLDVQQRNLAQTKEMVEEIERQRRGLHTTRIVVAAAASVGVIALGLAAGVGVLYQQVDANTHQVQEVQARTSGEILCPLYQVFAVSIKANPPSPNLSSEQAKLRQDAANTILAGLNKLGCT